jgi:hypothetical protein
MPNWVDGVIVSLLAIGASVVVGILGYLVEKSEAKSEGKSEEAQPRPSVRGSEAKTGEPAAHRVEAKRA